MDDALNGARDKFTSVNGLKLHYLEWGSQNPETVLLLHGFANCAATWYRLAHRLAAKRRVISLDHRGHGDSAWAELSAYTLDDHASDVAALVAQLNIEHLSLVGHSMGSAVAQRFAAKHPTRVERLVLVDNGPRFNAGAIKRAAARPPAPERMASPEVTADYLALGDRFAPREILLREAGFLTRPDHDGGMRWKAHQTNRLPKLTPADIAARWRILKSIRCPVLIVRGQESPVFEAALALEMTRMMAAARLIQIPNAGHYVHRDNPELFDKAVLEFLC